MEFEPHPRGDWDTPVQHATLHPANMARLYHRDHRLRLQWLLLILIVMATACGGDLPTPDVDDIPSTDLNVIDPLVAEALAGAKAQIVDQPRSATAWGELGMVFDAHGFRPEAESCYLTAAELNGEDYRWPYLYAQLLVVDNPIGAIDAFRQAHAINPADPTVSLRAGDALLEAGRLASVRSQFQATLSHPQASPYGHFGIARLDLLEQRLDQASDHLEAAVAARWEYRHKTL